MCYCFIFEMWYIFWKCSTFFEMWYCFFSWKLGRIQNLRNVSRYRFKHKIKVPFNKRSAPLSNSSYKSCRDQFLFVNQLFVNKLRQKNRLKSCNYWYLILKPIKPILRTIKRFVLRSSRINLFVANPTQDIWKNTQVTSHEYWCLSWIVGK